MAFNTRCFGFRGIDQLPIMLPKQYNSDSVFQLVYPYEWAQTLVVSTSAVSSAPIATPDRTTLLYVEVPDGQAIRFEINPPGRSVAAFAGSPRMSGVQQYYFRQGYTISVIDAAALL